MPVNTLAPGQYLNSPAQSWQWQPDLDAHDPNPPLTLEDVDTGITFVSYGVVPADQGSQAGPTITFPQPDGIAINDCLVVYVTYETPSTSLTYSVTTDGGQSWSSQTIVQSGVMTSQVWIAVYNGTWSADPVFRISSGGTNPMSGVMLAFRRVHTVTPIDTADTGAAYSAPGSPFDVTITGIDPVNDGAMVVAFWDSDDDNAWGLQTPNWANPGSAGRWRNLQGTDMSMAAAYLRVASGSSGDVTNRQALLGGDAGTTHILALMPWSLAPDPVALPIVVPAPTITLGALRMAPHPVAIPVDKRIDEWIDNPDFETNTAGWTADAGVTIARVTSQFHDGIASLEMAIEEEGMIWQDYAPTWATDGDPPDIGDGSVSGRYAQAGDTIFVWVGLVFGSTTDPGTGEWSFTLPVADAKAMMYGSGIAIEDAVGMHQVGPGTHFSFDLKVLTGEPAVIVSDTVPFTWGQSDSLYLTFWYERYDD